jgi:hypothetical protein
MKTEAGNKKVLFFQRTGIRLLSWFVLIGFLVIVLFILLGYFAALKPESFLPKIERADLGSYSPARNKFKLANPWYILNVDENGNTEIKTNSGEIIMSGLTYYAANEGMDAKIGLDSVSVKLVNDSTISVMGKGAMKVVVNVLLTVHKSTPNMDVSIITRYNAVTLVRREALVAKFDVPVTEVYRKNRKIDVKDFDSEYWLQRQGVRFGSGSRSSLIYNTPHVSSLQLETRKKLLVINLEYYPDHPYIRIPYQKDGGGKWIDCSVSNYETGSERNDNFSMNFGFLPKVVPRLMLVPQGYLAGYVFTEHADSGNIMTHRAAYFGDENITNIKDAVGGFAGRKIPVTKSVFYADSVKGPSGTSIRDDSDKPKFLDFLDQLNATGLYEICLHTPEPYNSNRETLNESVKFMKERFDAISWIDHGIYSGKTNRESFVCDGLDPNSEFYAADIWEKYNTRYFWNTADEFHLVHPPSIKEDIRKLKFTAISAELWKRFLYQKEYNGLTFFRSIVKTLKSSTPRYELNCLQPLKGNSFPTPLYWQNLTRTKQFYSWVTDYDQDYSGLSAKNPEEQVNKEERQLNQLSSDWGVFFNHGYFARRRKGHDVLSEKDGRMVINPFFDKILAQMAAKRDKGELYLTTVRGLMDYWLLLEKIYFEYMPDGSISVHNDNDKPVKGLSLVLHADNIRIDGETPQYKQTGDNRIIWFDIHAKGDVNLKVVQ